MRYYAAVLSDFEITGATALPPYNILASYHYFKRNEEGIKSAIAKGFNVFLDSGAFSAANSGKDINIDEYSEWVKRTGARIYAGLDVIGDPISTAKNMEHMIQKHNLDPIPTFHLGSDPKHLRALYKYPYIALGGLVFSSNVTKYCDEIWSIILKENPGMRVHGFGLTNFDLMARYPWYSVDSSSYKGCRRFGRQQILWDGFDFRTFQEKEYIELLVTMGYDRVMLESDDKEDNKKRWFIYDMMSVQSYKQYGSHLAIINKTKDFSYLTAQQKLI